MVEYFIIPDFSELDARGKEVTGLDSTLARGLGKHHLKRLGLDNLVTTDGKRLSATILVNAEMGGARRITIEAPPKSSMANLPEVLSEIVGRSDIDDFRHDNTGTYFTKIAGSRRIEFAILGTADQLSGLEEDVKAAKASAAKVPTARAKKTVDITDYFVLGERRDFEAGSDLERKAYSDIPDGLSDILHAAINRVETEGGKLPLVLYTTEKGMLQSIDIMPPAGRTVTRVELGSEAMPTDQRIGMVRCAYGPVTITIHRRHLDEKFDIRGYMDVKARGKSITAPRDEEQHLQVMQLLCSLPMTIRPDYDTEANVVYDRPYDPRRIYITPKGTATITVSVDKATEDGIRIKERFHKDRVKEFEIAGYKPETTIGVVIFTTASESVKDWEKSGGTGKRDIFDDFYEMSKNLALIPR